LKQILLWLENSGESDTSVLHEDMVNGKRCTDSASTSPSQTTVIDIWRVFSATEYARLATTGAGV
jgi:hypothetical protein